MVFLKYQPTCVKLPNGFLRDYVCFDTNQKEIPKKNNPNYDYSNLFYDVFFSLDKKFIWAIGPPLFSLKKILPLNVFYKNQRLVTKFYDNEWSILFRINAPRNDKKEIKITFEGHKFYIKTKVSSFPILQKTPKFTLSVLQKDYSSKHIIDWILWHHRLYQYNRILIYDNNSKNQKELIESLQKITEKNLEIIFIQWNYFYQHPKSPGVVFCQMTQLNHTLKIHYNQNNFIANLDIDEFLINKKQILQKQNNHILPVYDLPYIIDKNNETDTSIKDFIIRKKNYTHYKYIYQPITTAYISDAHNIYYKNQKKYQKPKNKLLAIKSYYFKLLQRLRKALLLVIHRYWRDPQIYVIHAHCLKIIWKEEDKKCLHQKYNPRIHIADKNIRKLAKQARL